RSAEIATRESRGANRSCGSRWRRPSCRRRGSPAFPEGQCKPGLAPEALLQLRKLVLDAGLVDRLLGSRLRRRRSLGLCRRWCCVLLEVEHLAARAAAKRALLITDDVDEEQAEVLLDLDLDEPRPLSALRTGLDQRLAVLHHPGLRVAMEQEPHVP